MAYTIEEVNGCTKKLLFKFDSVDLTNEIKLSLAKKQAESNLKGFRKGKAPLNVIEQMFGSQIENEALRQFISNEYFEAIQKEELHTVGYPMFDNTNYQADKKSVSFDAVVEIFPKIELKDYSKLSFTKDKIEIKDEELESLRNRYLESKSTTVEITDENQKLEKGMISVINFQGVKEDGERPENMKGEEHYLEIGSNQFIPGFEEGLVGMKKGEKKNVELTFPKEYHAEELKGAKVTFEVELLEIKKKEIPAFTDEMAKEFGYESVEDFETKNRKLITSQKENASKDKLQREILDKLIEENDFDIPTVMLQQQKKSVKEDIEGKLKQQGFNDVMVKEYFNKWTEDLDKKAKFQVKSALILETLAKKYEIEAKEEDIDGKIDELAANAGMERQQLESYYKSNAQVKNNLLYVIREEKTFDKLIADMKVTVK